MFGGLTECLTKPPLLHRKSPALQDNLLPSNHPYHFGHVGPHPNTNYKRKLSQHKQRALAEEDQQKLRDIEALNHFRVKIGFIEKTDNAIFRNKIRSGLDAKMKEYEAQVEIRRDKLRDLLAKEEREFCKDTVEYFQKGKAEKQAEIERRARELQNAREEERQKLLEEKRIQQYMDKCENVRPYIEKKHLMESKYVQLQQMRENESKRQSEKEWNMMWDDVMNRDTQAKMEREKQEAIEHYNKTQKQKEDLESQIKGKELLKQEIERIKQEDFLEAERIAAEERRAEIERLKEGQRKRYTYHCELNDQIKLHEKIIEERNRAEKALDDSLVYLSRWEYKKEKEQIRDTTEVTRKEINQYRRSLAEMTKHRQEEERKLDELLEEHRKMIEQQQNDARCKLQKAKEKLHRGVLEGRAAQIEHKKQEALQQLRKQEAENELLRLTWETNKQLTEESARLQAEAAKQYRADLQKQIDYNNLLREKERQELERQMQLGKQEEEKYRKHVANIIKGEGVLTMKHPFRAVLEQYDCQCPNIKPTC